MRFDAHYSSSAGNFYVVTSLSGEQLWLEAGVPWRRIQQAVRFDLSGVRACCLSHAHNDHSRAAADVLRAGVPVWASKETLGLRGLLGRRGASILRPRQWFTLSPAFGVFPFAVHHDVDGALGFIVHDREADESLLFATDTSHISERFATAFDIIAVECSYDAKLLNEMVEGGYVPELVARRMLTSHMEQSVALRYVRDRCDLRRCREVHLLHGSETCLEPYKAAALFENHLFIRTIAAQRAPKETPNAETAQGR